MPAGKAADAGFVAEVVDLVNRVYADAETGLWRDGAVRTDPAEVAALISAGELVGAWVDGRLVGAVRVQRLDAATRIGYQHVRTGHLAEAYPDLQPQLATPCDFAIYHKPL